ncbi:hypothetical protein V5T82_09190 [Magnetovibrio sp. PR-2]|uniref:hypothetical protein n=1 Tax=Magnetovibrio sp. PR-2 TaxID=3120356 RepID=UPI002FCDF3B7
MLKGLVMVMGFLIVLLMGLIIYGFYQKAQNPDYKMFRSNDTTSQGEDATATLKDIPAGSMGLSEAAKILSVNMDGKRAILLVARDGVNADLLVVIDTRTGQVLNQTATHP